MQLNKIYMIVDRVSVICINHYVRGLFNNYPELTFNFKNIEYYRKVNYYF